MEVSFEVVQYLARRIVVHLDDPACDEMSRDVPALVAAIAGSQPPTAWTYDDVIHDQEVRRIGASEEQCVSLRDVDLRQLALQLVAVGYSGPWPQALIDAGIPDPDADADEEICGE